MRNTLSLIPWPCIGNTQSQRTSFLWEPGKIKRPHPSSLRFPVLSPGCLSRMCAPLLGRLFGAPGWEGLGLSRGSPCVLSLSNYLILNWRPLWSISLGTVRRFNIKILQICSWPLQWGGLHCSTGGPGRPVVVDSQL